MAEFTCFFMSVSKRLQTNSSNQATVPQQSVDKQEKQIQGLFSKIARGRLMTQEALVDYLGRLNLGEQHKIINILANRGYDMDISQHLP